MVQMESGELLVFCWWEGGLATVVVADVWCEGGSSMDGEEVVFFCDTIGV